MMSIRAFTLVFLTLGTACANKVIEPSAEQGQIITIEGPISSDSLGTTLIHEHVFLDWTDAIAYDESIWKPEEAFEVILPYLMELKEKGVRTFLECTPAYLGRNPELLLRLANATGLQILTNTGFYAARGQRHLPELVKGSTAGQIAQIWIDEHFHGIGETKVKPGFIKIGVDSKDELDSLDVKIVRAAAITHKATGLTIVGHTGTDTTAAQQLDILAREGVGAEAFVWTHAQNGTSAGHVRLARRGTWISLDGLGWIKPNLEQGDSSLLRKYSTFLELLKKEQLLDKVLISHDAGWYTVGQSDQSKFQPYSFIFDELIEYMTEKGFTRQDFITMLTVNPAKAYQVKVRPLDTAGQ